MIENNSRILVAGASGMAGISIIQALLHSHPEVRIRGTWNRTPPSIEDPRIEYLRADLTLREHCRLAAQGCDHAVLAAANTGGIGSALSDPALQVTDNLVMDSLLLEALHRAGVRRSVYVSSATVYQAFDGAIREDQLDLNRDPHGAYLGVGWAKRAAEKLCAFWYQKYGASILIARSANIFGPYARFDPQRSNFIPALIRKAVDGLDPFEVWGSPTVSRDVIYAADFAAAVVRLLEIDAPAFDIYNLGHGAAVTVGEVVNWALEAASHRPATVNYSESAPASVQRRALDCGKIRRATGWRPQTSVALGIAETMAWWRRNKDWWSK
jgi:nucleoside-diphosphate-sugar epimerase